MLQALRAGLGLTAADKEKDKQTSISRLAAFLEERHPADVLMPTVAVGEKAPKFSHRGGTWTWERFKQQRTIKEDVCIVLQDLAVVDVDSEEQALALEARFPILTEAPAETTRRGRHYFFRRTPRMETQGYYDGAGQRVQGVDLKTRTRTGAGGIIVVAPSTNKAWLRPPWHAPVLPMPDDLLDAVAAPLHETRNVLLTFPANGGELFLRGCRNLRSIEYFSPFLEGRWSGGGGGGGGDEADAVRLPVPVPRETFLELLNVMEHGDLTMEPTQELFAALHEAADMMCVSPKHVAALRPDRVKRPHEQADLFATWPEAWRADSEERARRRAGTSGDAALVRVDAALAGGLRFCPLATRDDRWLLPGLPRAGGPAAPGDAVLRADPPAALAAALPPLVAGLLKEHAGHVVLAGGSVTGAVVAGVEAGEDYDLFLHGLNAVEAEALAEALVARLSDTHLVRQSRFAITFVRKDEAVATGGDGGGGGAGDASAAAARAHDKRSTVQLILRLYRDRSEILESFDFAPAKAVARWDADGFVVEAPPPWVEAVKARAFWVDSGSATVTTVPRVFKYVAKGFDAFVPGTRRSAFLPLPQTWRDIRTEMYATGCGRSVWRGLFVAEAFVLADREHRARKQFWRKAAPISKGALTVKEAQRVSGAGGWPHSDYEGAVSGARPP
jgi:hypothetical protein